MMKQKESLIGISLISAVFGMLIGGFVAILFGFIADLGDEFNLFMQGSALGGACGAAVMAAVFTHLDNKKRAE